VGLKFLSSGSHHRQETGDEIDNETNVGAFCSVITLNEFGEILR